MLESMSANLRATFQFLARTKNQAAVEVLVAGLDCPHQATREEALRALLERPAPDGHIEVFWRLPTFDQACRAIVNERPERLISAAGEAVQHPTPETCAAACDAILAYRLYETLPAMLAVLDGKESPNADQVASAILKLADSFYGELCAPDKQSRRKDMDTVRQRLTSSLEESLRKFARHRRPELVEAFLLIAKPQNVTFRSLLQQPNDAAYPAVLDVLANSPRGGVIRLLLGFLEEPTMPQAVRKILVGRNDVKFVENMVLSVGTKPSKAAAETLGHLDGFAWAAPQAGLIGQLSELAQACAVSLLMASAMKRNQVLEVLGYLLRDGQIEGRRSAAHALAEIEGPEAAGVVIRALSDDDPVVRAHALRQIRPRKVPGALSLLIRMVDTPHEEVRQALREALPEFSLHQFLANFDSMDETTQAAAGHIVRKIDPDAASQLAVEMERLSPVRRRRAVMAADAMDIVPELEQKVIRLLSDDDHMVRIAVAKALADCGTKPSWEALRDALLDRSVIVKETAEQSLEQLSQSLLREVYQEKDVEGVLQ